MPKLDTIIYYKRYKGSDIILIDYYLATLGLSTVGLTLYNTLNKLNSTTNDNDTTAILGYKGLLIKQPIKLDFKQFPSLSISGVTNSGKSCLVTNLINSTKLNTILVNAYPEDYKRL